MLPVRRSWPSLLLPLLALGALLCGCNYVVLGDSIGTHESTTYATEYAQRLHTQPTVDAVDGEQLPAFEDGILHNAQWRKDIAGADVITLSIGSNDLDIDLVKYEIGGCDKTCVDSTLAAFEAQYARTLDELRAMTKARITVLDIYDPLPALIDDYVRGKLADINAFIHRSACAHGNMMAAAVNLAFNGADGTSDPNAEGYLASDGTHPSALGAQVIAAAVATAHC
jgi:lysophospholipase L1-like esterase